MANEKIINLDNLKKFRQEYDTRIKGGAIDVGRALVSKQLEPVSEESGSEQTAPFLFQATGTDNNTTSTPTAPVAKHLELRGNTVKWNQLVPISSIKATSSLNGITFTNNGDGSITINGTANDDITDYAITNDIPMIGGNKKCFKFGLVGSAETYYIRDLWSGVYSYSNVIASPSQSYAKLSFSIKNGEQVNVTIFPQIFDLTLLGKEYESVLAFNRDYPLPYYAYDEGTLKSCKSSKLVTIGCNAFDGEFVGTTYKQTKNLIRVIGGQTYVLSQTETGFNAKIIYQYDYNGTLIKATYLDVSETSSIFTVESNCYTIIFIYDYTGITVSTPTNVMVRLSWNESHDYVNYDKHEYNLPEIELRSVGSAYDEITNDGIYTKKIGITTTLSDLVTNVANESGVIQFGASSLGIKANNDFSVVVNLLCSKYITANYNETYSATTKNSIAFVNNTIAIQDDSFIGLTVAQIKTYLSSVQLQFELETPIVSEVSAFAENIEVNDFGTMEFVATDSTEEVIIPQGNKFFYPADYVLFLDDMYNRSKDGGETSDANNFVTQSELQEALENVGGDAENLTDEYSSSSNYAIGDLVIHDNVLYICTTTIATAESWNSAHWTQTTINAEFAKIKKPNTFYGNQTFKYESNSNDNLSIQPDSNGMSVKVKSRGIEMFMFSNGSLYFKGKILPAYPSNTGTWTLKCVNGTLTWVED